MHTVGRTLPTASNLFSNGVGGIARHPPRGHFLDAKHKKSLPCFYGKCMNFVSFFVYTNVYGQNCCAIVYLCYISYTLAHSLNLLTM